MSARMTPGVAAIAGPRSGPEDEVDVVLELEQLAEAAEGSRTERIARQKARFNAVAEPVKAAVLQSGGSVKAEAWINCTIKARVPARAIERLKDVDGIVTIDVPHQLYRE